MNNMKPLLSTFLFGWCCALSESSIAVLFLLINWHVVFCMPSAVMLLKFCSSHFLLFFGTYDKKNHGDILYRIVNFGLNVHDVFENPCDIP